SDDASRIEPAGAHDAKTPDAIRIPEDLHEQNLRVVCNAGWTNDAQLSRLGEPDADDVDLKCRKEVVTAWDRRGELGQQKMLEVDNRVTGESALRNNERVTIRIACAATRTADDDSSLGCRRRRDIERDASKHQLLDCVAARGCDRKARRQP